MLKDMDFYHLRENIKSNDWIQDLFGLDSKNAVHEAGDFIGNKIAYIIAKSKDGKNVNPKHETGVQEIIILPVKNE